MIMYDNKISEEDKSKINEVVDLNNVDDDTAIVIDDITYIIIKDEDDIIVSSVENLI